MLTIAGRESVSFSIRGSPWTATLQKVATYSATLVADRCPAMTSSHRIIVKVYPVRAATMKLMQNAGCVLKSDADRWLSQRSGAKLISVRKLELESEITCPHCACSKVESMPTNACQFFYDCTGCGALLKPLPGDCCVFCSYGSVKCPPIQAGDCC